MTDPFYIGWQDRAAPGVARFVRTRVAIALIAMLGAGAAYALVQPRFAASFFEFGTTRTFEGRLEASPYPMLAVPRPGGGESHWLLTVFGKSGAEREVGDLVGHRVRITGTLVYRGGVTMLEIAEDSIVDLGEATQSAAQIQSTEPVTLRGEIVDSKCYLGVMNPGSLKTHRACAALCIRGGVPPVLLVRENGGTARYYLLVDADGRAVNDRVLDMVAEPIEVEGRVAPLGSLALLYADPDGYRRVPSADFAR